MSYVGGPSQVGAPKMSAHRLGTGEVSPEEAGAVQSGREELGIDQPRVCEVGVAQIEAAQIGVTNCGGFTGFGGKASAPGRARPVPDRPTHCLVWTVPVW